MNNVTRKVKGHVFRKGVWRMCVRMDEIKRVSISVDQLSLLTAKVTNLLPGALKLMS